MSARRYVFLDIENARIGKAADTLRSMRGVKMVDMLEGSPNLMLIFQAHNRQRLAWRTNESLALVESMTENIQLLPVQGNGGSSYEVVCKANLLPQM